MWPSVCNMCNNNKKKTVVTENEKEPWQIQLLSKIGESFEKQNLCSSHCGEKKKRPGGQGPKEMNKLPVHWHCPL